MSTDDSHKSSEDLQRPADADDEYGADAALGAEAALESEAAPSLTVMVGGEDAIGAEPNGSGEGDLSGAVEPSPEDATSTADGGLESAGSVGKASDELKRVIEALIFASPDPLTPKTLFKVLDSEPREDVQASLDALIADYAAGRGGLHLVEVAGGYQIVTLPELSEWVRRLFHERKTSKLTVQGLETLAVIAYKQPITAPEIAEIRGVNTSGVIATLLERRLIKIAGRKQVVGRPFLYATTREFLIRFGLKDLNDLPKMEDMADVLGFEPPAGLAEAGPSETMLPLEGPDPDTTLAVPPMEAGPRAVPVIDVEPQAVPVIDVESRAVPVIDVEPQAVLGQETEPPAALPKEAGPPAAEPDVPSSQS